MLSFWNYYEALNLPNLTTDGIANYSIGIITLTTGWPNYSHSSIWISCSCATGIKATTQHPIICFGARHCKGVVWEFGDYLIVGYRSTSGIAVPSIIIIACADSARVSRKKTSPLIMPGIISSTNVASKSQFSCGAAGGGNCSNNVWCCDFKSLNQKGCAPSHATHSKEVITVACCAVQWSNSSIYLNI